MVSMAIRMLHTYSGSFEVIYIYRGACPLSHFEDWESKQQKHWQGTEGVFFQEHKKNAIKASVFPIDFPTKCDERPLDIYILIHDPFNN